MHRGATTDPAMRQLIQTSDEPVRMLAERLGVNPKTVMKWRHRRHTNDLQAGNGRSGTTILTPPEQEMCLAFRKATLLPLDDCLYALQLSLPHLTRATASSLPSSRDQPSVGCETLVATGLHKPAFPAIFI